MPRMLFVAFAVICWPAEAAVMTLSCDETLKADEEQAKPQTIAAD